MTDRMPPVKAESRLKVSAWLPAEQDATEAEVERLIDDPDYCFEEKYDGRHLIAHRLETGVVLTNRKGEVTGKKIYRTILAALGQMEVGTIVAGEYLDRLEWLVLFDLVRYGALDCRSLAYRTRREALATLVPTLGCSSITLARHAADTESKRQMLAALRAEFAEGVIVKFLEAPYSERRLPFGGPIRRLKFRKECDVVVRRRTNDTTRSLDMFVFDDRGEIVNVGSVSAYDYYNQLEPGGAAVARVSYLYLTEGKLLYGPPVILEFRDDKAPMECSLSQLVLGKRFIRRSA